MWNQSNIIYFVIIFVTKLIKKDVEINLQTVDCQ